MRLRSERCESQHELLPRTNSIQVKITDLTINSADLNQDGEVGFADFPILSNNFGRDDVTQNEGDISDGSGGVDYADFPLLHGQFKANGQF